MNYFELYGIPVTMKPDPSIIRAKFIELSRQYHPDYHTGASEEAQEEVLTKSSEINRALKVFSDPDETIRYVLQLNNLALDEEKYDLDPLFLGEVMEINEELMDLEGENDLQRLEKLESDTNLLKQELYENVATIIQNYTADSTTEKELLQVKDYYYKKKYLQRILDKITQMRNIASP